VKVYVSVSDFHEEAVPVRHADVEITARDTGTVDAKGGVIDQRLVKLEEQQPAMFGQLCTGVW
jgi:hypothetical protein